MEREELINRLRDVPCWAIGTEAEETMLAAADTLEAVDKRIAELEAEVERLKASNEELREKQTYIDHYGDAWSVSGNDVLTVAYNHGFIDGEQACNCGAMMHNPCADCQEFDCYGCEYKNGAER